jgi:hypothetical protein
MLENGLKEYILNEERTDFLSQNKEGIIQLIGYSACYLSGISLGKLYLNQKIKHKVNDTIFLISQLL